MTNKQDKRIYQDMIGKILHIQNIQDFNDILEQALKEQREEIMEKIRVGIYINDAELDKSRFDEYVKVKDIINLIKE